MLSICYLYVIYILSLHYLYIRCYLYIIYILSIFIYLLFMLSILSIYYLYIIYMLSIYYILLMKVFHINKTKKKTLKSIKGDRAQNNYYPKDNL